MAIARKLFGVFPNAAWIPSSSSFASPLAVAGSIGVKRGIAAPFVLDAKARRRVEWSWLDATSRRGVYSCPKKPSFCLFGSSAVSVGAARLVSRHGRAHRRARGGASQRERSRARPRARAVGARSLARERRGLPRGDGRVGVVGGGGGAGAAPDAGRRRIAAEAWSPPSAAQRAVRRRSTFRPRPEDRAPHPRRRSRHPRARFPVTLPLRRVQLRQRARAPAALAAPPGAARLGDDRGPRHAAAVDAAVADGR